MRLTAIVVIISVLTLLTACGGGDSKDKGAATSTTPSAELQAAVERAVNDALLTLQDVPNGWIAGDPEADDPLPRDYFESEECATFFNEDDYAGSVAEAETPEFGSPVERLQDTVESDAAVYATAAVAESEVEEFEDRWDECRDQFEGALRKSFDATAAEDNLTIDNVSIELDDHTIVPAHGAYARGFRFTLGFDLNGQSFRNIVDSYQVRIGSMLGSVTYTTYGELNPDFRTATFERFAEKLKAAEASLPD